MTRFRLAAITAPMLLATLSITAPSRADAQAWAYPAFQPPRVIVREYNFGIADADRGGGASIVFQWREQSGPSTQFSFDLGIADTEFDDNDILMFGGVGIGHRLGAATNEVPIDFLLTGGIYPRHRGHQPLPACRWRFRRASVRPGRWDWPHADLHPRLTIDVCMTWVDATSADFDLGRFPVCARPNRGAAFPGTNLGECPHSLPNRGPPRLSPEKNRANGRQLGFRLHSPDRFPFFAWTPLDPQT